MIRPVARFIAWRNKNRAEKKFVSSLPPGAEPGFTDELFVQTGKHHKKEPRRAQ